MDEPKEAHHNKHLQFWLPTCLGIQLHSILLSSSVRPKKMQGCTLYCFCPRPPPYAENPSYATEFDVTTWTAVDTGHSLTHVAVRSLVTGSVLASRGQPASQPAVHVV